MLVKSVYTRKDVQSIVYSYPSNIFTDIIRVKLDVIEKLEDMAQSYRNTAGDRFDLGAFDRALYYINKADKYEAMAEKIGAMPAQEFVNWVRLQEAVGR